jgi:putative RNA 2'-phosphotransferase
MNKDLKNKSKYLSYLLRHEPESIGLELDESGWASIDQLVALTDLTRPIIDEVVFTNDKQRFAFSSDGEMIRANQGHSVQGVSVGFESITPPDQLYHGTVEKFLNNIRVEGLRKMDRHHVHLSATIETAKNVGSRRGKPIILIVDSASMSADGFEFYLSANGVWLTDNVPEKYIQYQGL